MACPGWMAGYTQHFPVEQGSSGGERVVQGKTICLKVDKSFWVALEINFYEPK